MVAFQWHCRLPMTLLTRSRTQAGAFLPRLGVNVRGSVKIAHLPSCACLHKIWKWEKEALRRAYKSYFMTWGNGDVAVGSLSQALSGGSTPQTTPLHRHPLRTYINIHFQLHNLAFLLHAHLVPLSSRARFFSSPLVFEPSMPADTVLNIFVHVDLSQRACY